MDITGWVRKWVDEDAINTLARKEKKSKKRAEKELVNIPTADYILIEVHETLQDVIILKWKQCPGAHNYEVRARRVDGNHVNVKNVFDSYSTGFYLG